MNVLVYANRMTIGGEQMQAVDLGAAIRDRGHEVVITAPGPGPLVEWANKHELPFAPLNVPARGRPSIRATMALSRLVRRRGSDLIHAYGVPSTLEAFLGSHIRDGVGLVASMLAASPARPHRRLPRSIPLIMVTRDVQQAATQVRGGEIYLLEPPVNVELEHPGVDGSRFRSSYGLRKSDLVVVSVSRLARLRVQDKMDGIERTIRAVGRLARELPVRLMIVGSGPELPRLREKADRVNGPLGRPVIELTGGLVDPAPAYAAADVVVGQAGSILRGMAFGKPAVVLGDGGFSEIVSEDTVAHFKQFGWWGIAHEPAGSDRLYFQLKRVLTDDRLRDQLGRFGRKLVCRDYSVQVAAASLERIYERTLTRSESSRSLPEVLRTCAWIAAFKAKAQLRKAVDHVRKGNRQNAGAKAPNSRS